jgi:tetratricopeptide (TPR) repeat protein
VLKATHPQPEFRFQSAREFISALQSRSVPYKINSDNIKADRFFEFAKRLLNQKHWTKSKKFIDKGLELYPESALGNIISGQYYVKTNQLKVAKGYLDKAISLNLGVNIKKELAEILIDEGNYPQANSLLQSHIQLNPSDWEAYNLLSESYYLMNRFELSIEILSIVIKSASKDCFWNNLLIAHLNNESLTPDFVSLAIGKTNSHSFINYNKLVYLDKDKSWTTTNQKKDKYLYQSYRFNNYKKQNQLQITVGKTVNVYSKPIISIGRNKENDLILNDNSVSRRHSVIINYFDDVWIYDMGSTQGTYVDGQQITRKFFLQGEHKLKVGEKLLTIKTDIYKII